MLVTLVIRPADAADVDFLLEMVVVAAFWRPDGPRGSVGDVLGEPRLAHYVEGWPRVEDFGVVVTEAQDARRPVGAAWARLFPESDPGYGFVDAATPEVSMGVVSQWRGRGAGSRLLAALIASARERGLPALSLSVERDNYARAFYERLGFRTVAETDGSQTMRLRMRHPG